MTAMEFIQERSRVQEEAQVYVEEYLTRYNVETRGVYIQDVIFPDELVRVLTQREIAQQEKATYMQQRKYLEAQKLLEAGLAIREQTSGQRSGAYAAGLVKLGDLAVRRNQPKEAEAFYTKAISLGDRPEAVPALLYLGMREKDYEQGFNYFQRALNADYNGPDATRALMWMAVTRQRQDRIPEAPAAGARRWRPAGSARSCRAPEASRPRASEAGWTCPRR